MTNKFHDTLNKLMTSTQYQDQEEVLRDLEVLRDEYLFLDSESEADKEKLESVMQWMTDAKEEAISGIKESSGYVWSIYSAEVDLINRFFEEFSEDEKEGA